MNTEYLKKLCSIKGASGEEQNVAKAILEEIKDYIDDYTIDRLGNLIAHKKGPGKKMMLAGHTDQIGMMVNFIDENGYLYFASLGGLTPHVIHSARVIFSNGVVGVIGSELLDDPAKLTLSKMYIDIGASDKEEAEKYVQIGDVAVYCQPPYSDDYKIVSPALDDRVGCFIMTESLKRITTPAFDLYFVFTVQEEVGLRGAKASAYTIEPDYSISFDVTRASETAKSKTIPQKMGKGACIKIKDNLVICHPSLVKHMKSCAEQAGIKHQFEVLQVGGTDAGAITLSKGGVPSGVISVPTRYTHSMNETARLSDISDCIDLTVKVLQTEPAF